MSTNSSSNGRRSAGGKAAVKPAAAPARANVSLDLDSLEREDRKEPFTFRHQDHVYTVMDVQDLDWQDHLRALGDPVYFLRHAMEPEDAEKFFSSKCPSWKLEAILTAFRKHYGLPDLGELAGSST